MTTQRNGSTSEPGSHAHRRVVTQRKRIIVLSALAFAAFGACLNAFTPPVYRATVRLEIRKPPDRSPLTGEAIGSSSFQSDNVAMYTAAELITNRGLLGRVAEELEAREAGAASRATPGRRPGWLPRWIPFPAASLAPGLEARGQDLGTRIDWLETLIHVEPVRDTRLVDVKVEHNRGETARWIADRLAQLFIEYQGQRTGADVGGLDRLKSQLDQVRTRIESEQEQLYGSDPSSLSTLQARVRHLNETVANLNAEYVKARDEHVAITARLSRLEGLAPDRVSNWEQLPIESPALDALRRDLQNCQMRLSSAREIYREEHPKLKALESDCASLADNVRKELERAVASLRAEQTVLAARETDLAGALAGSERDLSSADDQIQRRSVIESELKIDRDLYALLTSKIEEGRIEDLMKSPSVDVVDPATVDPRPVRPRKAQNLLLCVAAGTLLGVGIALLRESRRPAHLAPLEVEEQLELRVLGVIPKES